MLVFLSDTHLTDVPASGPGGSRKPCETLDAGAFQKFAIYLKDMAETVDAKQIEIVFLGDIFDVVRSERWLKTDIRPWSEPSDHDGAGFSVEDYTQDIVKAIIANPTNQQAKGYLADFLTEMRKQGRNVTMTYIVGNHDWLVNRYPAARTAVASFLGMPDPTRFATEGFWPDYATFARHGDVYDSFNFDGDRDASSLGDAIVIDLLTRFSVDVENAIGANTDPALVAHLREIDHVRPLMDVPLWVYAACNQAQSPAIAKEVKETWNHLVDEFLAIPFVRHHKHPRWWGVVDVLRWGLRISEFVSLRRLARWSWNKSVPSTDDYADHAYNEKHMRRNEARAVLYGHTHLYQVCPLDCVHVPSGPVLAKLYLNTGTWRRVHERAARSPHNQEFLSWHEMTFVAFYLDSERVRKPFEVWHGALE